MRQALRVQPDHPAAVAKLGGFPRITGELEAAEAVLRDTIAREPPNAGARLNLVADMPPEERTAEALALLDEVPPPADDIRALRHWHLQHALVMLQLGQPAEARAVLDALAARGPIPPEIAPLWHGARCC